MKRSVNSSIVRNVNSPYSLAVFMAVTSILVWAVIGSSNTNGDQIIGHARLYRELQETITAEIQNITQQVYLLEVGIMLSPKDFCSPNRLTPSQNVIERIFKLIDILPATSSSMISNPRDCRSVAQAYTESLDEVDSLIKEEARGLMNVLREEIHTPATSQWLSLYRYLQYEEEYEHCSVSTHGRAGDTGTEDRQEPCGSDHWYMEETFGGVLKEWEEQVGKSFVKSWLNKTSTMMEMEKKVQRIKALLRVQQMGIQEDSAEPFYSITLSPVDWCKQLYKRVNETEVQALHYLEEQKRMMENEVFEAEKSFRMYNEKTVSSESRQKDIEAQLQELVQEQILLSVKCRIAHEKNFEVCSNYKEISAKVSVLQHQFAAEIAMSSIYGDKIQHSSEFREHQDNKLRAMTDEVQRIKSQAKQTPSATMAAEAAHSRQESPKQNSDTENGLQFRFTPEAQDYHQLWRLTAALGGPMEVPSKVREIATYLNTEATKPQVSAKLLRVDIHRDWLDLSLFNTNYVFQKTNSSLISSGRVPPLDGAPHHHPQDPFLLPLYPSAFLLATDVQLTFYNISDPASIFRLAYEPRASGSYGPFSFGPMYRGGDSRRIKFRVDRSRATTVVSLPGAQLIGYICSVVPKFPKTEQ